MNYVVHIFYILAITVKAFAYYGSVGIEKYPLITLMLTVFYLAAIYFICGSKKLVYFCISIPVSLLMLTNVLYNRYFHMFFSLGTISQAGKLREVGGIALDLARPADLLLFADPVLPSIFAAFAKKRIRNKKQGTVWARFAPRAAVALVMAGSLVFLSVNPKDSRLVTALSHQELFTWHVKDSFFRSEVINAGDVADMENAETEIVVPEQLDDSGYLHGIASGRNLIVIQMEAFQDFLINAVYNGQELTPNLNRLVAGESIYFSSYYQQLGRGNTSDAEFVTNNSLYPVLYGSVYELYYGNRFYGLPWVLKENGYRTIAFHGYRKSFWNREKAYPGQGFDVFVGEEDLVIDEKIGYGLTDKSFFRQVADILEEMEQPFYSFIITLTSHVPFKLPAPHQEIDLLPEDEGTLFGDYIQAVHYTDEAIGGFIESLKEHGLYENSIIALYGDHFGIDCKHGSAERVKALLGSDYTYGEMLNVPLIIHIPGSGIHETVDTVGGQVDFMPTILNLLGISGKNLVMFGHDLLQAESGFVASQTYLLKGSFIDDQKVFEMARTGIFDDSKAWDRKTGEPLSIDTCREGYERAIKEITKSTYLLENDLLRNMDLGGTTASAILDGNIPVVPQSGDEILRDHDTVTDIGAIAGIGEDPGMLDALYGKGLKLYFTALEATGSGSLELPGGYGFEKLAAWFAEHQDAYLVIPISGDNINVLKALKTRHPDICGRVFPIIGDLGDHVKVEYQGFRRILLDLGSLSGIDAESLSAFLDRNRISGAWVPEGRSPDAQLLEVLESRNIAVLK